MCGHAGLTWQRVQELLRDEGEQMSSADLNSYLMALTGSDSEGIRADSEMDARSFSQQLLGFEDFSPGF